MGMLVERLNSDDRRLYIDLANSLTDLLATGKHDHAYSFCLMAPNKETMPKVKAAWKQFLQDQGPAIRNGKHFDRNSPEVRRLLNPDREERK